MHLPIEIRHADRSCEHVPVKSIDEFEKGKKCLKTKTRTSPSPRKLCNLLLFYCFPLFYRSATMEPISIELTIQSCKDLKAFNFFQKLAVYAAVWIDDIKKKQKTQPDKENGNNPEWKHEMKFELIRSTLREQALYFNLLCDGVFGGKVIGEVHVPIKDLFDDYAGGIRFVSYQVRDPVKKPNGVLNFSYKFSTWEEKKENDDFQTNLAAVGDENLPASPINNFPSLYPSLDVETPQELFSSPMSTQAGYPVYPPPPPPPLTAAYPPPPPDQFGFRPPPPPPDQYGFRPPPPQDAYFPPPPFGSFPPPPPPPPPPAFAPPDPYGFRHPGYPYPQFGHS